MTLCIMQQTLIDLRIDSKDTLFRKNLMYSAKIHVDVASSDYIWLTSGRGILQVSAPQKGVNTFELCCRNHVRWKLTPGCIRQHLISNCCTLVVDG